MDNNNVKDFVKQCGELLKVAKPHLVSCEYRLGNEMPPSKIKKYPDEDEYVLITCENGYTYDIFITGNSLMSTATAIFSKMTHK